MMSKSVMAAAPDTRDSFPWECLVVLFHDPPEKLKGRLSGNPNSCLFGN